MENSMKTQGFGKSVNNKVVDRLKVQILPLLKNIGESVILFNTTKKRKQALSEVVNALAPQYPELHFQVCENGNPLVLICSRSKNQKTMSYTWVERSEISNKWRVMATAPGAWDSRCICVWNNEERAIEIAEQIFPFIINMPLKDWITTRNSYQTMMDFIPDDDDSIIGIYERGTQKTVMFNPEIQEHLQSELNQSILSGDDKDLMKKIKYFASEN